MAGAFLLRLGIASTAGIIALCDQFFSCAVEVCLVAFFDTVGTAATGIMELHCVVIENIIPFHP